MPRYRKKVCRECGRVYVRHYVRTSGALGWCGTSCYKKSYLRRKKGKAPGEPPDPFDDSDIQEPRVMESLADVLRRDSMKEAAMAVNEEAEETEDNGAMDIDVVADRSLVPQTRFGEDNRVGVEWVGRCWAWQTEGEAPTLREVVVKDREVVKLLEPGQVRRVRAIERAVETPEGAVDGLEVWMKFQGDPEPDRTAAARGLYEGGMVRVDADSYAAIKGKVGMLERFTAATLIVDGRRYIAGLTDLVPVDDPKEPPTGTEEAEATPKGD